jgi:hypothetical protein
MNNNTEQELTQIFFNKLKENLTLEELKKLPEYISHEIRSPSIITIKFKGIKDSEVIYYDIKNNILFLNFGQAVEALKEGKKVQRIGWNGKGMWLMLQIPDQHSKMTLPYVYMFTADKNQVPWLASQTDVLSEDWIILD